MPGRVRGHAIAGSRVVATAPLLCRGFVATQLKEMPRHRCGAVAARWGRPMGVRFCVCAYWRAELKLCASPPSLGLEML